MKGKTATANKTPRKIGVADKQHLKIIAILILVVNVLLFSLMVFCLQYYADLNTENTYNQNLKTISNVAVAKSELAQSALDAASNPVKNICAYCDGKTLEETIQFLTDYAREGETEYQLLTRVPQDALDVKYEGFSSKTDENGNNVKLTYLNTPLTTTLAVYGEENNSIAYSPRFTSLADAMQYYAPFRGITLKVDGQDVRYYLLNPQTGDSLLTQLSVNSQYANLTTAVIDSNGNYLTSGKSFKGSNFYDYIYKYNEISVEEKFSIRSTVLNDEDGAGILHYTDSRKNDCVYAYSKCNSDSSWYVIICTPKSDFFDTGSENMYFLYVIGILCLLLIFDSSALLIIISKLRESAANEKKANQAKTDFLSHMSHEMRTPLNAITSIIQLIAAETNGNSNLAMLLGKVNTASAHLLNIINDVLDFSKIGDGKMTLNIEEFALADIADTLNVIYGVQATEKFISLVFDCDFDKKNTIKGDSLRLKQVLVNLVSNAIKYNNKGGYVKVHIHQKSTTENGKLLIYFEVEDNGIGIKSENLSLMFEPFTRDYNNKTKAISGTGLGLAISRQLISLMGGDIQAESNFGEGSRFFFTLPFEQGAAVEEKSASHIAEWSNTTLKGIRILLVEDNELNSYIAQNLLLNVGAEVELAFNGKESVDMFVKNGDNYYDLILMDIRMPVMDGFAATEAIRNIDSDYARNIPILALSANAFKEDVDKSLMHGMNAHLLKPIDTDMLYQTIFDFTAEKLNAKK